MHNRLIHYAVIVILVVIAYVPIYSGDFVFDDQSLIRNNSYITQLQSISSYLSQEDGIVDEQDKGLFHTGYYRPLLNVTYFVDYKLWGMNAYGFRTTNLILHLVVCFLLYELLLQFTERRSEVFLAVLLFAVHPLHTETVSIIVSRNNILVTIFVLASFCAYHVWWRRGAPLALAVSLLCFTGAVFSKEFGLMALPILFLYQRFLSGENNLRRETESYIPYLAIVLIYFVLRRTVVDSSLSIPDDLLIRIAYVPYLIAYNLKLIFLPYNLHSFSVLYPDSLLETQVIGSMILFLLLAIVLYRQRNDRLVVFSAAAFFVTLLPVLNLLNKASTSLIAMRWLYLPLTFLAFGFIQLLAKAGMDRGGLLRRVFLPVVAVYFVVGSYTLNAYLWHDNETFLKQEVTHFSNELYMSDYAEILLSKREYGEAESFFQKSLSLKKTPVACDLINYGALLIDTGRPQEALEILGKARFLIMGHKDRGNWNNNMGAALTLAGNYERAHEHFNEALALDPQNVERNRNLAFLLLREGRIEEATQRLRIVEHIGHKQ